MGNGQTGNTHVTQSTTAPGPTHIPDPLGRRHRVFLYLWAPVIFVTFLGSGMMLFPWQRWKEPAHTWQPLRGGPEVWTQASWLWAQSSFHGDTIPSVSCTRECCGCLFLFLKNKRFQAHEVKIKRYIPFLVFPRSTALHCWKKKREKESTVKFSLLNHLQVFTEK